MPLQPPNLDDRNFDQLLQEATDRIRRTCPGWTDLTPSDPGIVLLDVFAFLTEMMVYRLNRIPEKAYIEFLRLIGVKLQPPSAASVNVLFSVSRASDRPVEIPRGTRITLSRPEGAAEPPVFMTARAGSIEPGKTEVEILAHHCELVEAELAGKGIGLPGQWVTARRPPIVAPTGEDLDLVVGVEAAPSELDQRVSALQHHGKAYRVWREVENFTNLGTDLCVYIADRITGTVSFAPEARMLGEDGRLEDAPRPLANFPEAGREIRLWYRRGGGPCKAEANTLNTLKDPIPGVLATNPKPATGGRAAETLENALQRGPQDLHSLQRAVTARDFELVALRSSGAITRARAFTKMALWKHAQPGTVEMLLVPHLPEGERESAGQVTAQRLYEHQTEVARQQIQAALEERRPLGTNCDVNWARYKTVKVQARFVTHPEEDAAALKARVRDRLYGTITPVPTATNPGWRFGQALRVSNIYDIALAEPGVSYVDRVKFIVDEVPQKGIHCLTMDAFQPHTWYAGAGSMLFRSIDDADGWEPVGRFTDEDVRVVCSHPDRPGLLAVCTSLSAEKSGSRVHISWDCGETWTQSPLETGFRIQGAAWVVRDAAPILFLATDLGLFEVGMQADASPVQVFVSAKDSSGFYAVSASGNQAGGISVAVAAQATGGVFLSNASGKANTFRNIGLGGEDVRVLAVRQDGPVYFLWAGAMADAGESGKGCFSWTLLGDADPPEGWQSFGKNWVGGSCQGVAFQGAKIIAASHHAGVLRLAARRDDAAWEAPALGCGLPLREAEHLFYPVETVAGDREGRFILAGGPGGIYRSKDGGASYATCSSSVFTDRVTLPPTWLFCSGEHEIEIVSEDEAERD